MSAIFYTFSAIVFIIGITALGFAFLSIREREKQNKKPKPKQFKDPYFDDEFVSDVPHIYSILKQKKAHSKNERYPHN